MGEFLEQLTSDYFFVELNIFSQYILNPSSALKEIYVEWKYGSILAV